MHISISWFINSLLWNVHYIAYLQAHANSYCIFFSDKWKIFSQYLAITGVYLIHLFGMHRWSCPISISITWWIKWWTYRSVSQSINQLIEQSIHWSTHWSTNQSINWTANQPTNQPTEQTNKQTNKSSIQSSSQSYLTPMSTEFVVGYYQHSKNQKLSCLVCISVSYIYWSHILLLGFWSAALGILPNRSGSKIS